MNYRLTPNCFGSSNGNSTVVATAGKAHQTRNEVSPLAGLKESQLNGSFVGSINALR